MILEISYASGTEGGSDTAGADLADQTTNSYGGYCDLAIGDDVLTLAGFMTNWEEDNNTYEQTHDQFYVAYAHPLPIENATIKFAVSQASASDDNPAAGDLNYNF